MRLVLLLLVMLTLACGPRAASEVRPTATPQPPTVVPTPTVPRPTSTAMPPTSTPTPDYGQMKAKLLIPLSGLIVAVRDKSPQAAGFLARFNTEADDILPRIELDVSKSANVLHSAIGNVRSHPGNLAALEQDRQNLISDIP